MSGSFQSSFFCLGNFLPNSGNSLLCLVFIDDVFLPVLGEEALGARKFFSLPFTSLPQIDR